jgi:hypothetical protein
MVRGIGSLLEGAQDVPICARQTSLARVVRCARYGRASTEFERKCALLDGSSVFDEALHEREGSVGDLAPSVINRE